MRIAIIIGAFTFVAYILSFLPRFAERDFTGNDGCADNRKYPLPDNATPGRWWDA